MFQSKLFSQISVILNFGKQRSLGQQVKHLYNYYGNISRYYFYFKSLPLRSTAGLLYFYCSGVFFHTVFWTQGNLDWLVKKLIFHSNGMFYYNSFNRNISPLLLLALLKYIGRDMVMIHIIRLSLNGFSNLQMDTHQVSFRFRDKLWIS